MSDENGSGSGAGVFTGFGVGFAVAFMLWIAALVFWGPAPEWTTVTTVSGEMIECIDFNGNHFACFEAGTRP